MEQEPHFPSARLAARHRLAMIGATLAALILRTAIPPKILIDSPHDDELMLRLASEILDGRWLGPYEGVGQLTLSKPAGYPLFLAAASRLPWEVPLTVHLLICAGSFLFVRELLRLGAPRLLAVLTYGILVLYPLWFGDEASRLYREGLLVAVSILSVALAMRLARRLDDLRRPKEGSSGRIVMLALGFGLVLSVAVATKAGWVYLASTVMAIPIAAAVLLAARTDVRGRTRKFSLLAGALLLGLITMPAFIISMNSATYGVAILDSYAYGEFPRTYAAMSSVRTGTVERYRIVGRSQREAIYAVSPTAGALEPFLEVPDGEGWRYFPCVQFGICDDAMVWFPWDLRHAIEDAGLGASAKDFEATNRRIREDIEVACSSGALDCGSAGLAPGLPPLSRISRRELIDAFPLAVTLMLSLDVGSMERRVPPVTESQTDLWARFTAFAPGEGAYSRDASASLRNRGQQFGALLDLSSGALAASFWPILVLMGLARLLPYPAGLTRQQNMLRRLAAIFTTVTLLALIGQLALLEVGAGSYLSVGGRVYLLPAHALLVMALALLAVIPSRKIEAFIQREALGTR